MQAPRQGVERVLPANGTHNALGAHHVALVEHLFGLPQLREVAPVDRDLFHGLHGPDIVRFDRQHPPVGLLGGLRLAGGAQAFGIAQEGIDRLALVADQRGFDFRIAWLVLGRFFQCGDALFPVAGGHGIKPLLVKGVGAAG